MKLTTALAAIAMVISATVFAADPPATPSATPVKHPSLKACNKEADAKKLAGKERAHYVLACKAGKTH
ncbi:MAG: hypothetical protein PVS2B3_16650 [Steroidobacteraceae bacterium]